MRIGGEERWIAAEDAGLYRDALGAVPPGGLPEAFLEPVEEPLARLVRRYARTHGPFTTARARRRATGSTSRPVAARARARRRRWSAASCGRAAPSASGATPRCCAGCGARRWPRCARRSSRPSSGRWRASCPPGRASTPRRPGGAGVDRLREVLVPLQGVALAPEVWERDVLPRRVGRLLAGLDGPALRAAASWSGSAPARSGAARGRVALYFREDAPLARPAAGQGRAARRSRCTTRCASGSSAAPRSGPTCWPTWARSTAASSRRAAGGAVGPGLGGRGDQRRLRAAARAAAVAGPAAASRDAGRRFARRRRPGAPQVQGRWSLTAPLFARRARRTARGCARWPRCCSSATGSSPARPCWPRASPAASPRSTASWRTWRRSAPPAAATSSRGWAARSSRCRRRSSGCAALRADEPAGALVLAATDPANPYGASLPWPQARRRLAAAARRACRAPTW